MTQSQALSILKTGRNAFITGPAGSGKTFVVNEYIKYLRSHNIKVGITASTGIAATHMGGMTVHSWIGMGIKDVLTKNDIDDIVGKSYLKKRIDETKVLIIDEISMLNHSRLDIINSLLKKFKKSDLPFGGMQVILCGDFFQLPPISRSGERAKFVYESDAWKEGQFTICYLSQNWRQTDDLSRSVLASIRSGNVSEETKGHLKGRFMKKIQDLDPTRLYTHNADVDVVNDRELQKISENEIVYEMTSKGRLPLVKTLINSCQAPSVLRLRKGARVVCVKNNFDKGYVNGTLGVVVSCGPDSDPMIRTASDKLITIEKATWVIDDNGKNLAEIHQYPLRLAWAITVHKSQGMSLDAVEVDLSKSFEPGMGYVALSRVRSLSGLTLLGLNEMALRVNSDVLEYDAYLQELSGKAESIMSYTDEAEVNRAHEEFLRRANGESGKSQVKAGAKTVSGRKLESEGKTKPKHKKLSIRSRILSRFKIKKNF